MPPVTQPKAGRKLHRPGSAKQAVHLLEGEIGPLQQRCDAADDRLRLGGGLLAGAAVDREAIRQVLGKRVAALHIDRPVDTDEFDCGIERAREIVGNEAEGGHELNEPCGYRIWKQGLTAA